MANKLSKKELKDKVKISIFALEYDTAETFLFSVLNTVKQKDCRIDFSVLLSIKQKVSVEAEAEIVLIKMEETGDAGASRSLTLNTFSLSPERRKDTLRNSVVTSGENPKFDWDPYRYNDYMKFNFRNVPILGAGYYAVAVCVDYEDSTLVLDKQYFAVE